MKFTVRSDRPSVSVVLTAYNRGHALARTLDSILGQTFTDFELIIADDSSTDDTREICEAYVKNDSRVRYYRNETNLGMPGNLNAAVIHARGNYVANLHDGDIYRSDLLEKWLKALENNPSAAFCFNKYEILDVDGNPTGKIAGSYDSGLIPGMQLIKRIFSANGSPVWGTVMARRSAYEAVGPFDERFGIIADVDMWVRLAAKWDAAYVAEPVIGIREREKDHPWSNLKWQVIQWQENILFTNMERIYGPQDGLSRQVWTSFLRNWNLKCLRWLATDLVLSGYSLVHTDSRRYFGRLTDALDFMIGSHSKFLRTLGKSIEKIRSSLEKAKKLIVQ